jgi:F-type H+-transporting ATPase subunit b
VRRFGLRRLAPIAAGLIALAGPAVLFAQGEAQEAAEHGYSFTTIDMWKAINLVLLLAAAAYFGRHKIAQFFAFRTKEITLGIAEAARQREAAEAQYAAIEERLARIGAEIEALRAEAAKESSAEAERVREETKREMDKIRAQAEQEIASGAKAARLELQAYCAELAVGLAETRIREQLTPETDGALIESMVGEFVQRRAGQVVRAS